MLRSNGDRSRRDLGVVEIEDAECYVSEPKNEEWIDGCLCGTTMSALLSLSRVQGWCGLCKTGDAAHCRLVAAGDRRDVGDGFGRKRARVETVPSCLLRLRGGARATRVCAYYSALALLLITAMFVSFFSINCRWLSNSKSQPAAINCCRRTVLQPHALPSVAIDCVPLSIEKHASSHYQLAVRGAEKSNLTST